MVLVIIALSSVSFLDSRNSILQNHETDRLKHEAIVIDRALSVWYKSHDDTYPDQLQNLKSINLIPQSVNLANYTYKPNDDTYTLVVALPAGSTYKSPGSKQ